MKDGLEVMPNFDLTTQSDKQMINHQHEAQLIKGY